MTKIIELKTHPYKFPIAFEITGMIITCTGRDKNDRAIVNGVIVAESFREVIFMTNRNYDR